MHQFFRKTYVCVIKYMAASLHKINLNPRSLFKNLKTHENKKSKKYIELPDKGELYDWTDQETKKFGEQANKGQLYNSTFAAFERAYNNHIKYFEENFPSDDTVISDIEQSRILFETRSEWIQKIKKSHEDWHSNTKSYLDESDKTLRRLFESVIKYLLIGYGAAFLFALQIVTSKDTNPEILPFAAEATKTLLIGAAFAISFIWFSIELKHQDREYADRLLNSLTPLEEKENWLRRFKVDKIERLLVLISLCLPAIATLELLYKINASKWLIYNAKKLLLMAELFLM